MNLCDVNESIDNYFENIDVVFETHRLHLKINLPYNELRVLHKKWMRQYDEFEFNNIDLILEKKRSKY